MHPSRPRYTTVALLLAAATALAALPAQAIVRPDRGVRPGEAVWTAALVETFTGEDGEKVDLHVCTAVLIRPRVLLTAAHCVYDATDLENWVAYIGHRRPDGRDGVSRRPVSIVYHEVYERGLYEVNDEEEWIPLNGGLEPGEYHYDGDIAVVLLDRAVRGLPFAELPNRKGHRPAPGWRTYGWGTTGEDEHTMPHTLLTAAQDDHTDAYRAELGEPLANVYAAVRIDGEVVSATCWGDSGGPLVDGRGVVIGLTSWADAETCSEPVPTMFTRVASYLPWIDRAVTAAHRNIPQLRPGSKRHRVALTALR